MKTVEEQMKEGANDIKSLILAISDIRDDQVRYEAADLAETMLNRIGLFNEAADNCLVEKGETREASEAADQFFCSAMSGLSMAMVGTYDVSSALYWATISTMLSEQACSLNIKYQKTLKSLTKDYEGIMNQRKKLWSMATEDLEKQ